MIASFFHCFPVFKLSAKRTIEEAQENKFISERQHRFQLPNLPFFLLQITVFVFNCNILKG